jgi:hypothetical protein
MHFGNQPSLAFSLTAVAALCIKAPCGFRYNNYLVDLDVYSNNVSSAGLVKLAVALEYVFISTVDILPFLFVFALRLVRRMWRDVTTQHHYRCRALPSYFTSPFRFNTTLRSLNLEWNPIGEEGASILLKALRRGNTSLTELNIGSCGVSLATQRFVGLYRFDWRLTHPYAGCCKKMFPQTGRACSPKARNPGFRAPSSPSLLLLPSGLLGRLRPFPTIFFQCAIPLVGVSTCVFSPFPSFARPRLPAVTAKSSLAPTQDLPTWETVLDTPSWLTPYTTDT